MWPNTNSRAARSPKGADLKAKKCDFSQQRAARARCPAERGTQRKSDTQSHGAIRARVFCRKMTGSRGSIAYHYTVVDDLRCRNNLEGPFPCGRVV